MFGTGSRCGSSRRSTRYWQRRFFHHPAHNTRNHTSRERPVSRFKNPPIVEAWLSFEFEPRPDKVAWDIERAQEFTRLEKERFPNLEVFVREEFKLEKSETGNLPRIVSQQRIPEVVRMRDENARRVLQIADDRMAYNLLEGGPSYPGFETLVGESLEYLGKYRAFFQPAGIRQATIHYVDIVVIPFAGRAVQIDDFFTIARDLPETPFGLVAGYSTSFVTICPPDRQPLQILLAMLPSDKKDSVRFRMDWEKQCGTIDVSSDETTRTGLLASHEFMVECFEKSITARTRQLFEPSDGK